MYSKSDTYLCEPDKPTKHVAGPKGKVKVKAKPPKS